MTADDARYLENLKTKHISATEVKFIEQIQLAIKSAIACDGKLVNWSLPPFDVASPLYDSKAMLRALEKHFTGRKFECSVNYRTNTLMVRWSAPGPKPEPEQQPLRSTKKPATDPDEQIVPRKKKDPNGPLNDRSSTNPAWAKVKFQDVDWM